MVVSGSRVEVNGIFVVVNGCRVEVTNGGGKVLTIIGDVVVVVIETDIG